MNDAELERLALLSEEMAEAQQIIGKILRHGWTSRWPKPDGPTNREMLEKELGHVAFAMKFLDENGDVSAKNIVQSGIDKRATIQKWLHHNLVD